MYNKKIYFSEMLGVSFLTFILNNIESPPDTDVDEQIPDLFLNFVISFNLQFTTDRENTILSTLEGRSVAKVFTEKLLLLLNREGKLQTFFAKSTRWFDFDLTVFVLAYLSYKFIEKVFIALYLSNLLEYFPNNT